MTDEKIQNEIDIKEAEEIKEFKVITFNWSQVIFEG